MSRLLTTSALYIASASLLRLIGAAVTIWLATRVPMDEYGRFGLLWAFQQLVTIVTLGGIVEAVIGKMRSTGDPAARAQLFSVARLTVVLVAAGMVLLAACWALFSMDAPLRAVETLSVVAGGAVLAYAALVASLARLEERHVASVLLATVPPMAAFIGGGAAVLAMGNVTAFFVGSAIFCGLALIVTWGAAPTRPGAGTDKASRHEVVDLFRASAPLTIAALFGWLSGYGYNVLIERFHSLEEVGRYTLAFSLASAVHMVAAALNSVWMPRFYQLAQKTPIDTLEEANRAFYNVLAIALGASGGALIVVLHELGTRLGGNLALYGETGPRLAALAVGYVMLTAWWQCSNHLLANGAGNVVLRVTVITGLLGTLAWIVLMLALGLPGIYAGFVLMMMLRSGFLRHATRKYVRARWPWEGMIAGSGLAIAGWLVSALAPSLLLKTVVYAVLGFAIFLLVARRDYRRCLAVW